MLATMVIAGCNQGDNGAIAEPQTFQEQCAKAGIEISYKDPNAHLAEWDADLDEGKESDLIPTLDAMSGASFGTTYNSPAQQASTIKTFEQYADRQNQKIKTYRWYPKEQTAGMREGLYFEISRPAVSSLEEASKIPEAKYVTELFPEEDASEDNKYKLAAMVGFPGTTTFLAPDVRWHDNYQDTGYGKLINGDENGIQNANSAYLRQIGFMKQPATDPYNYSGEDRYVHIINVGHHSVQQKWMDPETKEIVEEETSGAELIDINPIPSVARSAVMNGNMRTIYSEQDSSGIFGMGNCYYAEVYYEVDYDSLVFFNQVTKGLPICMSDNTEQQIRLYPEQEISPYIGQDENDMGDWTDGNQAWERSWLMEDRKVVQEEWIPGTANENLKSVGTIEAPPVFPSKEAFIKACKAGDINYMDLYASKGAMRPDSGIYGFQNPEEEREKLVVTNFDLTLVAEKMYLR